MYGNDTRYNVGTQLSFYFTIENWSTDHYMSATLQPRAADHGERALQPSFGLARMERAKATFIRVSNEQGPKRWCR